MENNLLEAKSELKTKQLFIQIMLKVIFYVWQWTTMSIYINVSIFIKIKSKNISQNSSYYLLYWIIHDTMQSNHSQPNEFKEAKWTKNQV